MGLLDTFGFFVPTTAKRETPRRRSLLPGVPSWAKRVTCLGTAPTLGYMESDFLCTFPSLAFHNAMI